MKTVEIDLNKDITWPNKCAICNQDASTYAQTNYRNIDGYFFVAIRETTHRIKYPVCSKHKWLARFYGFVTNQAFATGLVMAIVIPFILAMPFAFTDFIDPKYHNAVVIALYGGFVLAIFYWKFRNPVKVVKVKNDVAKIRFRNEQYAGDFKQINS
jgi:hypothetical protein